MESFLTIFGQCIDVLNYRLYRLAVMSVIIILMMDCIILDKLKMNVCFVL